MIAPNEKSAATEVTTPLLATAQRSSATSSVNGKDNSPIAQRQVSRFRRFLSDFATDPKTVERFRESTDELCACGRFVMVQGQCFGCNARAS